MKNWERKILSDVCKLSSDRININKLSVKNYISTENLLQNKGGKVDASALPSVGQVVAFSPKMTLVSNIRPYFRKIYFSNSYGGCSNDVLAFIAKEGVSEKWLYYLLSQDAFFDYVMSGAKGTKMPRGDKTQIMNFPLYLPPFPEQVKMAHILDAIDEKISASNKINQNLEAQAQAIFKSWFVDFEPFKNGKFVDSELGKIPEGWRVGRLENVVKINSGKRPINKRDASDIGFQIPIIGASGIMGYTSDMLLDENILVTGRVGTHGVIQKIDYPCWPSDNTLVIKTTFVNYIYQLLRLVDWHALNRGTTQPLITQADLKNMKILLPDAFQLREYENKIKYFNCLQTKNSIQSRRLSQLRDTLLPKLMSGEIDVSDVAV